jgi:two-component sensor histidine kinase
MRREEEHRRSEAGSAVPPDEAEHRIANNLAVVGSALRIQAAAVDRGPQMLAREQVRHMLEDAAARIDSVAALHRLLTERPAALVDLSLFLQRVCDRLYLAAGFKGECDLVVQPRCVLPPDKALPLAMVLTELLTNVMRHARPKDGPARVHIRCRAHSGTGLLVEVQDNGPGLARDLDPMVNGGVGFRILRGLVRRLGATVTFRSTPAGLSVRLVLPESDESSPPA